MPTFRKRPEVVDARQFTGTDENTNELVLWIQSCAGEGVHVTNSTALVGNKKDRRQVRLLSIRYPNDWEIAHENDWIVLRQSGYFEVVRPEVMALEYEQV